MPHPKTSPTPPMRRPLLPEDPAESGEFGAPAPMLPPFLRKPVKKAPVKKKPVKKKPVKKTTPQKPAKNKR